VLERGGKTSSRAQSASKAVQKLVDRLRNDVHNLVSLLLMQRRKTKQDGLGGNVL
jgi:hypothetical protein